MKRSIFLLALFTCAVVMAACQAGQPGLAPATPVNTKPTVVIVSPPSNDTAQVGDVVKIQSTSNDAQGIVLVELMVDGQTIQNSPTPNGQPQAQFSVIQTWTPTTTGAHTITVKATNAKLGTGDASITLNIGEKVALVTPTNVINTAVIPTATALPPSSTPPPPSPTSSSPAATPTGGATVPPSTCILASTFLSDVTIPDGTVIAPGGSFVKTWAIQNSGTCTWGGGYNVIHIGGEGFGATSPQSIPAANPGATINVSVNMVAPTTPGTHQSIWQLQASNGVPFGATFDALINVPGAPTPRPPTRVPPTNIPPPPVGCSGAPYLTSFTANPQSISPGQITTISWGPVSNANAVYFTSPSGTQGVSTPGAVQVQPSQTTTYTLTAYCNNAPAQVQVTVYVNGGGGGCSGTPVFNGFYASPQTISSGAQTTLNWGLVQNANAVYLELPNNTVGVSTPGSRTVQPGSTTTYTLVAYCGNNQVSISTTVNVNGSCSGSPSFNGFSANPSTIQKGQSSTLSWGLVANATSVILQTPDGSSGVSTPGQLSVAPNKTTTYTLIAYCNNKQAQRSVTVTVTGVVPPTPTPPPSKVNSVNSIQVQKNGKNKWRLTINYYWNGEASPAEMEAVGTGKANVPATNQASSAIIPGFVKFVILNLQNTGKDNPTKFTACIIGKGMTELACKTVGAP